MSGGAKIIEPRAQQTVQRIALLVSFSGNGGVERMLVNLAQGMLARGLAVDMVTIRQEGAHFAAIPGGARIMPLGSRHTALALPALARYLTHEQPSAVLVAKDRAMKVAALARLAARARMPLVGRIGTTVSASLQGAPWLKRCVWLQGMRWLYPCLDRVIAISHGVAADLCRITGLPAEHFPVVYNPVVTDDLLELAKAPAPHAWLAQRECPVVVAVGRLTRQKDFPTLLRAFARLRARRPCRLVVLGDGPHHNRLSALAHELGVADDVAMPGFCLNPCAYLARADMFVLSSLWEGFGNVLVEAMALGVPVVATDCPSGPREILEDGRYGPLATPGDPGALADAMTSALDAPLAPRVLRQAAQRYSVAESTRGYLDVLGLCERGALPASAA